MNIKKFHDALSERFPKELSAVWDNDGIMCARDVSRDVKRVLVSLDPAIAAIRYAAENGFDTLLTHHPLIFKGIKSVTGDDTVSSRLIAAIENDIAVLSLHTRLDAGSGGVNDALAQQLGFEITGSFGDAETPDLGRLAMLHEPMNVQSLALYVGDILGGCVRVYDGNTGKAGLPVRKAALVGGSGKGFIQSAITVGADVLITGESGYNAAEAAAESGFVILEAGHYETEFPVCKELAHFVEEIGIESAVFDIRGAVCR